MNLGLERSHQIEKKSTVCETPSDGWMKGKVIDSLADLKQLTASQGNHGFSYKHYYTSDCWTVDVLSPIS